VEEMGYGGTDAPVHAIQNAKLNIMILTGLYLCLLVSTTPGTLRLILVKGR
jgi:hypothetical protein